MSSSTATRDQERKRRNQTERPNTRGDEKERWDRHWPIIIIVDGLLSQTVTDPCLVDSGSQNVAPSTCKLYRLEGWDFLVCCNYSETRGPSLVLGLSIVWAVLSLSCLSSDSLSLSHFVTSLSPFFH